MPRPNLKRIGLRDELKELKSQNAELRARLGLDEPSTEETWAPNIPQAMRDRLAARALIREKGDERRALILLGFDISLERLTRRSTWMPLAKEIFGTPGCQEYFNMYLGDLDANWPAIMARMQEIAIHGDDSEAVRAASQLCKVKGVNKADQGALPSGVVNIFLQAAQANGSTGERHRVESYDPDQIIDAEDFGLHEPGDATVIDDGVEPLSLNA